MDTKLEALDSKIEKLKEKKRKINDDILKRLGPAVNKTLTNGIDLQTLAGIILDAQNILNESPHNKEAWQVTGGKFRITSTSKTKPTTHQNHQAYQSI